MRVNTPPKLCLALPLVAFLLAGCDSGTRNHEAGGPTPSAATTNRGPQHPNVLFVVIDTLRRDRLGCYGYRRDTSPNIDRLASRSIVFERAFANSDGTILTHISLLSSRYTAPQETAPGPTQTLAQTFSEAGYGTYGVAANPTLLAAMGWGRGFDRYIDQPVDIATLDRMKDNPNFSRQIEVRSADQTTNFVLEALRRHAERHRGRPWFLFVNYLDPHDPYTERKPWSDQFRESASNISGTLRSAEWFTLWNWVGRVLPTLDEDDLRRLGELYDSEVRYTDTHLQRVFDYLRETDQDRNTVMLITSDHGEVLGEHQLFTHMLACFEVEIKVPLILYVPWLTETQLRTYELAESVDVGPTLLNLCHIPVPEVFQGQALIDATGRLRRTGRSYTRHTHFAVSPKQRRAFNFPAEAALDSVVLRFADSKVYFLADGTYLLFDISGYPQRPRVSEFQQLVPLLNRGAGRQSQPPAELSEEALEAFRSLGYIQ